MTGRGRVLATVLGVAVVVAGSARFFGRGSDASSTGAPSTSGVQTAQPANSDAVADVRLDLVRPAATDATPTVGRNLFRFRPRVEPVVFRPPPPPVQPSAPPPPPGPPPIALRFIGLLEATQSSGRIAILSDGRGNVINGKEGDIIEGRYRLLRVGPDSAEVAYLDGRGRQVIRLSGQ